jgi:mediator of RNA polymerase II transcription subunit 25
MIACLLHQTGWTTSLDLFFKWLSCISFSGGGFGEVAIAEGLAEALLVSLL